MPDTQEIAVHGKRSRVSTSDFSHQTFSFSGIWLGLMSLIACNFVADSIRVTRKDSPIAAVLESDMTFSFDDEDSTAPQLDDKAI